MALLNNSGRSSGYGRRTTDDSSRPTGHPAHRQTTSPAIQAPVAEYDAPSTPVELARRIGVDPEGIVKLDANENPYGPPPSALRALASVEANRYPDPEGVALKERLARYVGCGPDRLVLGNGSDELIDLICRAVLSPGESVIDCAPTFVMYAVGARACGATLVDVARKADFAIDMPALLASLRPEGVSSEADRGAGSVPTLVFLCSPNNPTGGSLSEGDLRAVLASGPLVVLDEAYAEYAGRSLAHLAAEYDNLVVLRTFSKAFGLAGLRIGYGIFPPDLARVISLRKAPYNVNSAAQAAALAALEDIEWVERHVALVRAERDRLAISIAAILGLEPLPSETNFLLVRVRAMPASSLFAALLERGIMVRRFQRPPLQDYLRITVGTPEQNELLLAALRSELGEKKREASI
jgi:histidinol-phosphate aminotransferase